MDREFKFKGKTYTAVYADWSKNGSEVYEIFDERDNFVTSINVDPFSDLETVIKDWIKQQK